MGDSEGSFWVDSAVAITGNVRQHLLPTWKSTRIKIVSQGIAIVVTSSPLLLFEGIKSCRRNRQ